MQQQSALYEKYGLEDVSYDETSFQGSPQFFTPQTRQAYLFTTENMRDYIHKCYLKGRKVASVAASGDFAFNAYLEGAIAVDCFDITPIACFFSELKKSALKHLSYEDFLAFFGLSKSPAFSFLTYARLRSHLARQTRVFFDGLIKEEGIHASLRPGQMLIDKISDGSFFKKMNPYLMSESSYEKARDSLKDISFYPLCVDAFVANSQQKYDLIHLSNIFCYPPFKKNSKLIFRTLVKALQITNKEGEVVTLFFVPWKRVMEFAHFLQTKCSVLGLSMSHFACSSFISEEHALFLLSVKHST